ncbi:hypothetical protein [uncultured Clostridium sp.]|uniref:hypothetical protein n=1 Tax=uncultured Clostridium sp. TaxID=59620 RepID=UPI0026292510|nr:hypothetical protein [uncultured Clostridium sp.]
MIINKVKYVVSNISKEDYESEIRSQLIYQLEPKTIIIDGIEYIQEALLINKF